MNMEDLEADLERMDERIEREEAKAKAQEELAEADLKKWKQERDEEAERAMKELEERVITGATAQPASQPSASSRDVEVPARSETTPATDTQDEQPSPIERFKNLEIPADGDERSASE